MSDEAKKSGSFMSTFVPGLVIGLVVGALAGAFLPPVLERMGMGSSGAQTSGPVASAGVSERDRADARAVTPPASPETPSTPAGDLKAAESKADLKPDANEAPKPADPGASPK